MSQCDIEFASDKRWDEDSTPYKVFERSMAGAALQEDIASLEAKYGLIESRDIGGVMLGRIKDPGGPRS